MNIQEAKEEIIRTVRIYTAKDENGRYRIPVVHQRPVLLIGPPGIGKTAIIRQAAEECGVGLVAYTITHHTRQSAVGLPVVEERTYQDRKVTVTEYTMSEIIASVYECMEQTGAREGILFIDEINCVSETLTPTMLQFLQNKTFGTHRVPEGWVIVAAGNPPEYNKSARNFDVVTLDRVKTMEIGIDFPVWKAYASGRGIHSAILSYLSAKPRNFYYIEETRGDREFVTARGWEDLSVLLKAYEAAEFPVTEEVIGEYLHCEKICGDFAAYYRMFRTRKKEYAPAELLSGTMDGERLRRQEKMMAEAVPDEQYSVMQMMLEGLYDRMEAWAEGRRLTVRKEELFSQLSEWKDRKDIRNVDQLLGDFLEQFEKALQVKEEHRLISEEESRRDEAAGRFLGQCLYRLKEERIADCAEGLGRLHGWLEKERKSEERLSGELRDMVERCMAFLEHSVGRGEELGYFMTSLSMNSAAAEFLSVCSCERYQKNLDLMVVSDEETELQRQVAELKKDGF